MEPYEDTRQKIETLVKSFHDTDYPSMEVNYQDRMITDVENVFGEFVTVELDMKLKHLDMQVNRCVRVNGQLVLNHFNVKGKGSKVFTTYSDAFQNFMGLKTLLEITFYEVNPFSNKNLDGFDGRMNIVEFEIEYFT